MANTCKIFLVAIFVTINSSSSFQFESVTENLLQNQHKQIIKKWEFELDDKLEYPRGDKTKLQRISQLWSHYYSCSARLARRVTSAGRLPAVCRAAFERARVRLPCGLCVSPDAPAVNWLYSPMISSQTSFYSLEYDERIVVRGDGTLTINDVGLEDAGWYRCTMGQSTGGTVVLEVVAETEPYDMVKPSTSHGPYPPRMKRFQHDDTPLIATTAWAPWSECSDCDRVGRRHRYGMCYVKITLKAQRNKTHDIHGKGSKSKNLFKLFQDYPAGLPCRSPILPRHLRDRAILAKRHNQIMIGLCKVPCAKESVFEVRSSDGSLLERANNTAGVFSLSQHLPLAPPKPPSEIFFVEVGKRLTITCPGTSLRNIPINWRVGTKPLLPKEADRSSGGRVHLDARDRLVFTEVHYDDENVYSCWQRDVLVATVKLEVWDARPYWNRHVMLLATLLGTAGVLRACDTVLRKRRNRAS